MTEMTVRELVTELAMGPIEDFDLPARVVVARRGLLAEPTGPVAGTPLQHSAGAWVTLTVRLQAPDRDLVVPGHIAVAETIAGLFGRPLLVDDIRLQHHKRWAHSPDAAAQRELLERMRDDAAANGDLEGAAALDERLKEDLR